MPTYAPTTTADEIASVNAMQIAGKVILITGVTLNGLGAFFCQTAAAHGPKLLILANRNLKAAEETAAAITKAYGGVAIRMLHLDLNSLASVKKAAAEVNSWADVPTIDVLVNNAGVMATPYGKTEDGIETQFGVNHVAHFLFTNLIMEKLLANGGARVVVVSSEGYRHSAVRFGDYGFDNGETYDAWRSYGQSKSANNLYAVSLAEKLGPKGIVAVSLHPGVIATNLLSKMSSDGMPTLFAIDRQLGDSQYWEKNGGFKIKTPEQGVSTHVYAAFDPDLKDYNGAYLIDNAVVPKYLVRPWARDSLEAQRLWDLSEELVGQKFAF